MVFKALESFSPVSVHFVSKEEFYANIEAPLLTVMEGSIALVKSEKDLFSTISSAIRFPDYFGQNWDALDECLQDMEWLPSRGYLLVLRDAKEGWSKSSHVLSRFVSTWLEASAYWSNRKVPFHLLFVM